jgi:hypothetical protein
MRHPDFGATPTLASTFEHFLNQALFARRTRESYTDDLAPLLTQHGQAPVSALTPEIVQEYLTHQDLLAPTTYNRRLAALRGFLKFLQTRGYSIGCLLAGVRRKPGTPPLSHTQHRQKPLDSFNTCDPEVLTHRVATSAWPNTALFIIVYFLLRFLLTQRWRIPRATDLAQPTDY